VPLAKEELRGYHGLRIQQGPSVQDELARLSASAE